MTRHQKKSEKKKIRKEFAIVLWGGTRAIFTTLAMKNPEGPEPLGGFVCRKSASSYTLAATHAVATVVTEIAVAVTNRDAAAIVTTRGIDLEPRELVARADFFAVGLGLVVSVAAAVAGGHPG